MLARAKSNIGPGGGGFGYSVEQIDLGLNCTVEPVDGAKATIDFAGKLRLMGAQRANNTPENTKIGRYLVNN